MVLCKNAVYQPPDHVNSLAYGYSTGIPAAIRNAVKLRDRHCQWAGWRRIATRPAADPAGWQRMRQEADQLHSGARSAGPTLAEVLGRFPI
ncbi:MAG TPA: hypothetical protein VHO07_08195 [Streptosporangiaceae bacterium]|nr:hypothetical protein [Streptosporangiaceae bacterium]